MSSLRHGEGEKRVDLARPQQGPNGNQIIRFEKTMSWQPADDFTSHLSAPKVGGLSLSSWRRGRSAWDRTSCDSVSFVNTRHIPSLILAEIKDEREETESLRANASKQLDTYKYELDGISPPHVERGKTPRFKIIALSQSPNTT